MSKLNDALDKLKKRYGEGTPTYGKDLVYMPVDCISTGSLLLDRAIGTGGFPKGRVTEVYGWEDSAKTTLCQLFIAQAQKLGTCMWINMERTLERDWAEACGVAWDDLLISNPDTAEMAMEIVEAVVRSGEVIAIVVDSVATLVPRAEVEGDIGSGQYGSQARVISQSLRKINPVLQISGTALVFVNQLRVKLGGWTPNPSITPETTSGGKSLGFYASLRLRLSAKKEEDAIYVSTQSIKNKIGGKFKAKCTFPIDYGGKVDTISEILDIAVEAGTIEHKGGGNFAYGEHKWRGKETVLQSLRDDEKLCAELTERIRK